MTSTFGEVDPSETTVFISRCAEQAELYEDMLKFLEPTMELKGNQMSKDERLLVSAAAKNIIVPD